MNRRRDRSVAIGAVVVLTLLAGAVVALVLEAQSRGIETREKLRLEQIQSEANRMESLISTTFVSYANGFGAPGAFTMKPGDPTDARQIAPRDPEARTGSVLVDRHGTIVNGALLGSEHPIGSTVTREGLDGVLESGETAVLPMGPGITTTLPTILIAVPVRDASGALAGAYMTETEVSPESIFNLFINDFSTDDSVQLSYLDGNGVVIASNDHDTLTKPLRSAATKGFLPGFHRSGGEVAAIADVPSAKWKLVFRQDTGEFQGDLTGPLQTALLLFLGAVGVIGVLSVVALLRRLQSAREEQLRLEEIGDAREEFTSIVSHELRTPVAGLLGFLQTTVDHWDAMNDPERRRAVGRAYSNARSLQTLTSDVLDSASIEARTLNYRFEHVDIRSCVSDAIDSARDANPERPITFTKPSDAVLVRVDTLRISQVLGNLLDNAAKSSAPDAPIDVEIAVEGRFASISVRDRGPGIAPEERERVFEKFTRGRAGVGRGTGLGLYISRHIIETHGGEIDADSVPGEPGARLRFTLPLAAS